jgi:hypothetical protein
MSTVRLSKPLAIYRHPHCDPLCIGTTAPLISEGQSTIAPDRPRALGRACQTWRRWSLAEWITRDCAKNGPLLTATISLIRTESSIRHGMTLLATLATTEKVDSLRRYLLNKVPVSDLCEELGLQPSDRRSLGEKTVISNESTFRCTRPRSEPQHRLSGLSSATLSFWTKFRFPICVRNLGCNLVISEVSGKKQ